MGFKYQKFLILNRILDLKIKNRLHYRILGWLAVDALRLRGSKSTTTSRRPIARLTARTTARTTCRTMTSTIAASVPRSLGLLAPGNKVLLTCGTKCIDAFQMKEKTSVCFCTCLYPRWGDVTCLGVMKKSRVSTNTLSREHLGW